MDNYYKNCPARMNDGNFLTNYKTSSNYNELIKFKNNIVRDDDYRLFLQQNAEKMMETEWNDLRKNSSCWNNACVHVYGTRMDPRNFEQERKAFDNLFANTTLSSDNKCKQYVDYRLTATENKP